MAAVTFAMLRFLPRPRGTARQRRGTWQHRRQREERAWREWQAVAHRMFTPVGEVHDSITFLLHAAPMTPAQFVWQQRFRRARRRMTKKVKVGMVSPILPGPVPGRFPLVDGRVAALGWKDIQGLFERAYPSAKPWGC